MFKLDTIATLCHVLVLIYSTEFLVLLFNHFSFVFSLKYHFVLNKEFLFVILAQSLFIAFYRSSDSNFVQFIELFLVFVFGLLNYVKFSFLILEFVVGIQFGWIRLVKSFHFVLIDVFAFIGSITVLIVNFGVVIRLFFIILYFKFLFCFALSTFNFQFEVC